jgi:hypothetical protein
MSMSILPRVLKLFSACLCQNAVMSVREKNIRRRPYAMRLDEIRATNLAVLGVTTGNASNVPVLSAYTSRNPLGSPC